MFIWVKTESCIYTQVWVLVLLSVPHERVCVCACVCGCCYACRFFANIIIEPYWWVDCYVYTTYNGNSYDCQFNAILSQRQICTEHGGARTDNMLGGKCTHKAMKIRNTERSDILR